MAGEEVVGAWLGGVSFLLCTVILCVFLMMIIVRIDLG